MDEPTPWRTFCRVGGRGFKFSTKRESEGGGGPGVEGALPPVDERSARPSPPSGGVWGGLKHAENKRPVRLAGPPGL